MDRQRVAAVYGAVAIVGLAVTTALLDFGSHTVDGPGPLAFDLYVAGIAGFGFAGCWAIALVFDDWFGETAPNHTD